MSDNFLDGCDLDFTDDELPDNETDLFVLFAEALDLTSSKTIEEAKTEWNELFK